MDFVLYQKQMLLTMLEIRSMIHHIGGDKFGYASDLKITKTYI